MQTTNFWIILGCCISAFLIYFIGDCFAKPYEVPEYLDPEHIDDIYIFRDFHGYDIMEDDNHIKLFTFLEAKDFAKENPSFHVKLNDFESDWEMAETYFNIY